MSDIEKALQDKLGVNRIRANEKLSKHCNWKVGGPADLFLKVNTTHELLASLRIARGFSTPVTLLGFGANSLVSDKGIRGLVILNRAERIIFHPKCLIEVDSGTNLAVLARRAAKNGIGNLEFLIGIPGTVGAAIYGNAGTGNKWISQVLERVCLLGKDGSQRTVTTSELDFRYRSSKLKETGEIVITSWLRGHEAEPADVEKEMKRQLELRKNQPGGPSAGSVFKNPAGDHAGRLIEACGLKGYRIGGAEVSEMHANFILNKGGATATDIQRLIAVIKATVEKKFGIRLREEIRYLGDFS